MVQGESIRTRMEQTVRRVQDEICQALEQLDGTRFHEDAWTRGEGNAGITRVMQNGNIFEKAGINTSTVIGTMNRDAARAANVHNEELDGETASFFVTSISLVVHPHNPMLPTTHAHYRYFELGDELDKTAPGSWLFGGGADLTPYYLFEEDVVHFHHVYKNICDRSDPALYPRFKQACDEYFYLPHRKEHRGVGGIFLGNLNDRDPEVLFSLTSACANAFLPAYLPIVERRRDLPFTDAHKRWQRLRRGRYVEFNLVCDRGTAFGLKTGGRTESILMSLPLFAGWEYADEPAPGTQEACLLEVLRKPRQWV